MLTIKEYYSDAKTGESSNITTESVHHEGFSIDAVSGRGPSGSKNTLQHFQGTFLW